MTALLSWPKRKMPKKKPYLTKRKAKFLRSAKYQDSMDKLFGKGTRSRFTF